MSHSKKYFKEGSNDIINTKELIELSTSSFADKEGEDIANISRTLILVKSIRKLTKSINENSESSNNLIKVGHFLTGAIIFLGIVELIILFNN